MTIKPGKDPVAWLRKLVACPSVNPRGGPADRPPFGEARLNAMLADELQNWGASVELQELAPGRNNLVACFRGLNPDRSLMLTCHSDTVSSEGMSIDPFDPSIREGRLYGRGACDTKGPMAAMLAALAEVLETDGQPPATVFFVATADEEQGATGIRRLVASGFRADAAVVGEPTDLKIVDVHKGVVRFKITVHGRAAHSSDPRKGVNAISKAAALIRSIDGSLSAELSRHTHPRLGSPVISVGIIKGGSQVNIVPDRCEIDIDRRLLPGETADSATAQLRQHLETVAAAEKPLDYDLLQTQHYPTLESDAQSPFGRLLSSAIAAAGLQPACAAAPWGSDAGALQAAGIPVFVFGPGSIHQAHSAEEFIDLKTIFAAKSIFADLIRRFH